MSFGEIISATREVSKETINEPASHFPNFFRGMTELEASNSVDIRSDLEMNNGKETNSHFPHFFDDIQTEESDRKKYYDDKGICYRIENDLIPDNEYELQGYQYETDHFGRIENVQGRLHLKDHEGRLPIKDSIEVIGRGYQLETDDRGHIIGDQFDGNNGMENIVPMDMEVNRSDFKKLENELAEELKQGKPVYVEMDLIYEDDSFRPTAMAVTYQIDGEISQRIFINGREC